MKTRITRLFTLCAIGTSIMFTSCVSEDISPQVEELRSAQADYLQAQAALEEAKAVTEAAQASLLQTQAQIAQAESTADIARKNAELALYEAQTAYQQALMDASMASELARLEAEVAQAQYERDLLEAKLAAEKAELEAMIAQAQVNAAQAQLALQEAIDALTGQINETAQEYLSLYQNTTEQANNKLDQITALEAVVARYEANLDANGNVLDFDQVALELEGAINADLAEIESLKAAIARLEGLNVNADGVREELTQVENRIDELEAAMNEALLDTDRALKEYEYYQKIYDDLNYTISNIDNRRNNITFYQEYIPMLTSELEEVTERLTPYKTDLEDVETQLTAEIAELQTYLDSAEDAFYNYEYVRLNGSPEEIQEAQDAYNAAVTIVSEYTGAWYGWGNAEAYVNWPNSGTEFGDAVLAVSEIEDYPTYNNLLNTFNNINYQLVNAQNQLFLQESSLNWLQSYQNDLLSSVEVATVDEYFTARSEAIAGYNEKWRARNALQSEIDIQYSLRGSLWWYLNDPDRSVAKFENQIAVYQDQITNLEADIEANQTLLAQNAFEADEMAAMIERTQEKIGRLMTEYNALVALANEYLEKFNEILENN